MPRRLAPVIHLVVALVLWAALPVLAGEGPRSSRPRVSAGGMYSVRLLEHAPGKCTLEVSSESGVAWTREGCVGGVDDLYFVSNDGQRVWVVRPLVEKGTSRRTRKKRAPPWAHAVVASLYDQKAGRVRELRLRELVASRELSEVRELKKHVKWLEGILDVPGRSPRLTDDQRVEFETVGGKTRRLTFN